jgi:hypothetical protein
MKKKKLTSLQLNKKSISSFNQAKVTGGGTGNTECASIFCWDPPKTGVVTCPSVTC